MRNGSRTKTKAQQPDKVPLAAKFKDPKLAAEEKRLAREAWRLGSETASSDAKAVRAGKAAKLLAARFDKAQARELEAISRWERFRFAHEAPLPYPIEGYGVPAWLEGILAGGPVEERLATLARHKREMRKAATLHRELATAKGEPSDGANFGAAKDYDTEADRTEEIECFLARAARVVGPQYEEGRVTPADVAGGIEDEIARAGEALDLLRGSARALRTGMLS